MPFCTNIFILVSYSRGLRGVPWHVSKRLMRGF